MLGSVRRKPSGVSAFGNAGKFRWRERVAPQIAACHRSLDAGHALLGLQRTHRVDQPPALAQQRCGGLQQPVLRLRQRPDVTRPLQVRHVGMPPDRTGGAARRIQQHSVELPATSPRGGVRLHEFGRRLPMPQVVP